MNTISLKCRKCNNTFDVYFKEELLSIKSCTKCGNEISIKTENFIDEIVSKSTHINTIISDFEITKVYQKGVQRNNATFIFDGDMKNLNELFNDATPEVQEQLIQIIDKLYLLIYHDAQSQNINALQELYNKLSNIHKGSINLNISKVGTILGIEL